MRVCVCVDVIECVFVCVCGKCWRAEVLTVCDNVTLQMQYGYVTNDSNTIKDIQVGKKEREKKEQKKMKSKQNQIKSKSNN